MKEAFRGLGDIAIRENGPRCGESRIRPENQMGTSNRKDKLIKWLGGPERLATTRDYQKVG